MPHLYCDRRSANEELQKLAHRDMVQELTSLSHQVYGTAVPMSWDQLEVAARCRHSSGSSMAEHIRTYVFERLAERRTSASIQRAYGCLSELRNSFTLPRTSAVPASRKDAFRGSLQALPAEIHERTPKRSKVEPGGKQAPQAVEAVPDCLFFATARGTVIHIQAPDTAWGKMCESRTARAGRPARSAEDVIEYGGYAKAKLQGRNFCAECAARARVLLSGTCAVRSPVSCFTPAAGFAYFGWWASCGGAASSCCCRTVDPSESG